MCQFRVNKAKEAAVRADCTASAGCSESFCRGRKMQFKQEPDAASGSSPSLPL